MCGHFIHFPQPHFLILTDFFSWQLVYTFMYILQQHPLGLSSCTELSDFFLHSHQTLFVTREDALKTYLPSEHWILQNLKPLICLRFFFCIWVVVKICNTCHCFFHTWWRLHTWCDALRNLLVPITVVLFDGLSTRRTSTTGGSAPGKFIIFLAFKRCLPKMSIRKSKIVRNSLILAVFMDKNDAKMVTLHGVVLQSVSRRYFFKVWYYHEQFMNDL